MITSLSHDTSLSVVPGVIETMVRAKKLKEVRIQF